MTESGWLLAMLGASLGTYVLRAAPFLWQPLYELGRRHVRFLTYVSFAIAAGIVSKALFVQAGVFVIDSLTAIKIAAVVIAVLAHRLVANIPLALFAGVGFAAAAKAWLPL